MPRALSLGVRQALFRAHQAGTAPAAIARLFGLPTSTVRHLLTRWRQRGDAALRPDYAACGQHRAATLPPLPPAALALRAEHPRWGAGRLRVELQRRFPGQPLPSERTLRRWLRRARAPKPPAGRPPAAYRPRADCPHGVWQVDACAQLPLATGPLISWLRVADECSGAVLRTAVFPPQSLQPGARRSGAGRAARAVPPLGAARGAAGGQRLAVGVVE